MPRLSEGQKRRFEEAANGNPSSLLERRLQRNEWDLVTTAHVLGVTTRTLRRWQRAGLMPERRKFGRGYVYRRDDILAMRGTK